MLQFLIRRTLLKCPLPRQLLLPPASKILGKSPSHCEPRRGHPGPAKPDPRWGRWGAYRPVRERSQSHRIFPGARGIVNSGLIPPLVWKLQGEEEEIQELLLDTLAACLVEDATEALSSRVVPFLKEKLLSTSHDIRSKATRVLTAVSVPLEGKKQVRQYDVIPILVHLLKDEVEEVRANAAGALMNALVTTEGKYAALNAEAILPLLQLTSSALSKARLNAVKALTMLAEAPEGRKFLQAYVHVFRALELDSSKAVRQAAEIATKVIEWEP